MPLIRNGSGSPEQHPPHGEPGPPGGSLVPESLGPRGAARTGRGGILASERGVVVATDSALKHDGAMGAALLPWATGSPPAVRRCLVGGVNPT